ncbi:hypothetical protein HPB50_015663 [Hyalomma asiaticum]|uniref:Uncharacterized protein n=1 Tax=Hyalomma asiaticum TaxID=266040 RepID=A0ACB7TIH7_HYAAI|nr:hypothetical protein HPB50_015663 [Hyalomma asiaticum]
MASAEATSPAPNMSPGELECMRERKWWCFLLSSIFTFLAGLFIILIWRALAFLCCRKEKAGAYSPGAPKQPTAKKAPPGAADAKRKAGEGAAEIGFMTEAKDWAGELISGQTTTGRILVRFTPLSMHATAPRSVMAASAYTFISHCSCGLTMQKSLAIR